MNILINLEEVIKESTIGHFRDRRTGHLYEGPFYLEHTNPESGTYKLRLFNRTTSDWEYLGFGELTHLERLEEVSMTRQTV